jgi:D-glycero-D-manno-heptose 1,7-bisphosphate phosphatase
MTERAHAAVFLDRDGTINEEVGHLVRLDDLRLLPGAAAAVRRINESGMKAVVVSNQSGVARGLFPASFVRRVHRVLQARLAPQGAHIDRFYYCPHHPEAAGRYGRVCRCRKPAAGLILRACRQLDIDPARSYLVGDSARDLGAARNAGLKAVLVRTGWGEDTIAAGIAACMAPAHIAADLAAAVEWIMRDRQS